MVGASSDVADLSYEVVLELMLDAQVPFHNAGNDALRSGGFYRAADVNGVSYRQGGWKASRNKLAVGRQRTGVVIIGEEGQLGRIQSQIVEDIGFGRIEHSESTSYHGIALH